MTTDQAIQQMAADMRKLVQRLAPGSAKGMKVNFLGNEAAGSSKVLTFSGGINTIQTNLLAGRVLIFFDHPGGVNQAFDFAVDASNNAVPIHFPDQDVRSVSFVVAPGVAAPKGTINLYLR